MDPSHIQIDGFRLEGADRQHPERAPVANEEYARLELRGRLGRKSNGGLEPARVVL
jgi:hypothetical protein